MLNALPLAHVKWFTDFDWSTPPRAVSEITSATFWSMLALSIVTILVMVLVDRWMQRTEPLSGLTRWFEAKSGSSLLVMRVALFSTLLVAWQQGTLFAPELVASNPWVERLQFLILVLLMWERSTPLAGLGMLAIWLWGVRSFGAFHMLDYVNVVGVAYFLIARPLANVTLQATALPALYATLGFSLMWLGCEKLVYPEWVNYILEQNPVLTFGLDRDFFRVASAFIELGLGFSLILGLFSRTLSITITLTFFCTTMVFGKLEIIGHTLIHAALIVFMFEGPGHSFRPPAYFHRALPLRMAFASVNFVIAVAVMLSVYTATARRVAAESTARSGHDMHSMHKLYEVSQRETVPSIELRAEPDPAGGWNLRIVTTNFRFAPENAGEAHSPGQGHVHLHVDGDKAARVYSEWFHLPVLSPGEHELHAMLNTNDHRQYAAGGKPIEARVKVTTP